MKTKLLYFLIGTLIMPLALASIEGFDGYMEMVEEQPEIQLTHTGGNSCGTTRQDYGDCDQEVIMAHAPHPHVPVYPVYSNICRSGGFYCWTQPRPLGMPCQCWDMFGFVWFYGTISPW